MSVSAQAGGARLAAASALALAARLARRAASLGGGRARQAAAVLAERARGDLLGHLAAAARRVSRGLQWLLVPDLMVTVFFRHLAAVLVLWLAHTAWRRLVRRRAAVALRLLWRRFGPDDGGRAAREERLERDLRAAGTYAEWLNAASRLDEMQGRTAWRDDPASPHYDQERIASDLAELRVLVDDAARALGGAGAGAGAAAGAGARRPVHALMHFLRARLLRNLAGIGSAELYVQMRTGTKRLIEEYHAEVIRALQLVCAADGPAAPPVDEKLAFFNETRHSYGRTALMLSGGAAIGMYHAGVVKGLHDRNLLPRIISGASVGAIITGIVGTRTDAELDGAFTDIELNFFPSNEGSVRRKLRRLLTDGVLMDISVLQACVRANIPDVTFKEAFERTGRIINVVVSPSSGNRDSARLLNYLTAPHVLVWSASLASCAIPGVYAPVQLLCKNDDGRIVTYLQEGVRWSDGSVHADLPMRRLAELFNVNHFIVSQTNPHIVPFLSHGNRTFEAGAHAGARNGGVDVVAVRLLEYLLSELRGWMLNLGTLGLFPESLDFVRFLLDQRYSGDITIAPRVSLRDYKDLLRNPTLERLAECTVHTERETWRVLPLVSSQCEVEFVLDEGVRRLRLELGSSRQGLAHVRSWCPETFVAARHDGRRGGWGDGGGSGGGGGVIDAALSPVQSIGSPPYRRPPPRTLSQDELQALPSRSTPQ